MTWPCYIENRTIVRRVIMRLNCTKYQSCGPSGFREEDLFSFSNCKSMETIHPRGVAKFDPRGMAGTIYVEDH